MTPIGRRTLIRIIVVCLLAGSVAQAGTAPAAVTYRNDGRLQKPLDLSLARVRTSELAEELEALTGVQLGVAGRIADDQITCLVRGRTGAQVVEALASVMRYRVTSDGAGGYRLDLDPTVALVVAGLYRDLDPLDSELSLRTQQAISRGIRKVLTDDPALGHDPEVKFGRGQSPELLERLKTLSPEELEMLADGAAEPPGPISATGRGQLAGRIHQLRAFSSFPVDVQERMRAAFERTPTGRELFQKHSDPLVGILAHHGAFSLCAQAEEEFASAPVVPFGGQEVRAAEAEIRSRRRTTLNVMERLQADAAWIDPRSHPLPSAACSGWSRTPFVLRIEPKLDTNRADRVLPELARKANISIVADSFTRSTLVAGALGLADNPRPGSASAWARLAALAFERKYRCLDGILLLRSRRFVWERYAEPPRQVVDALLRAKKEEGRLALRDYAAAGALTKEQVRTLSRVRTRDGITLWREALTVEYQRRLFAFLAFVPGLREAESGTATLADVPAEHRLALNHLLQTGERLSSPDLPLKAPQISWGVQGNEAWIDLTDNASNARVRHRVALGPMSKPGSEAQPR
jgi:hypothetical protein